MTPEDIQNASGAVIAAYEYGRLTALAEVLALVEADSKAGIPPSEPRVLAHVRTVESRPTPTLDELIARGN